MLTDAGGDSNPNRESELTLREDKPRVVINPRSGLTPRRKITLGLWLTLTLLTLTLTRLTLFPMERKGGQGWKAWDGVDHSIQQEGNGSQDGYSRGHHCSYTCCTGCVTSDQSWKVKGFKVIL